MVDYLLLKLSDSYLWQDPKISQHNLTARLEAYGCVQAYQKSCQKMYLCLIFNKIMFIETIGHEA
jgi:hypothetical protein